MSSTHEGKVAENRYLNVFNLSLEECDKFLFSICIMNMQKVQWGTGGEKRQTAGYTCGGGQVQLVKAPLYYNKYISTDNVEQGEADDWKFASSNALFAQMCYNICNKLCVMLCTWMHRGGLQGVHTRTCIPVLGVYVFVLRRNPLYFLEPSTQLTRLAPYLHLD